MCMGKRFSREDSARGHHLKEVCDNYGLRQLVSEPTRGDYLLDLCLSTSADVQAQVKSKIADHACILAKVPDAVEKRDLAPRLIWKLDDADWPTIQKHLRDFDWKILMQGSVDQALDVFTNALYDQMHAHIPNFMKVVQKSNLPWLNDKCHMAIEAKHQAEGTDAYTMVAATTNEILQTERASYTAKLKAKMEVLPKGSKRWWALNKQLLNKQAAPPLFPPLKNKAGEWCRTPTSKANLFADCWTDKCTLLPEVFEHFFCFVADGMPPRFAIRTRTVKQMLQKLRLDQATGPDGFSAKLLRQLADVICLPLAMLIRRIFNEATWPQLWRLHHIVPLFKRGSVFMPGQYRGVHLTSILSKVVERVIGLPLTAFLESHGFGDAQWAFRKKSSARDMVTICVAQWVIMICKGRKIGLYLSDISGAFDKVSRLLLIGKLSQIGLPSTFLDFLNSYLMTREGLVRVEGALSEAMLLCNMVFQGTVLGPPLWNAFFADVAVEVPQGNQQVKLFADDLTGMTSADQGKSDRLLLDELEEMQKRTHRWGRKNQVEFDPGKEHLVILHPRRGIGEDFKLLGTLFDCKLTMQPCLEKLLSTIRPKIRAIVRLKHLYSVSTMLNQYKCHIWGLKEYSNGALILASPSQLRRLDSIQRWYLRELNITDTEAFVTFNFAPPSMRRSIGLLGFLHKRALGVCHPAMYAALPPYTGSGANFHDKALHPFTEEVNYQQRLCNRSLYAYIHIYNRLPQDFVDLPSVSAFQRKLTHIAKHRAKVDCQHWRQSWQDLDHVVQMLYGP